MKIQPLIPLCSTLGIVLGSSLTFAQTVPPSTRIPVADSTLGTQVSGTNNNFTITGGVSRGQNLFQSFQDFSVPTGGSATFSNPAGNRAIITRVTGNLFSDIDGTINTQGANFFLINPNGMLFGSNTRLNVGQTFVGSTANGIDLVDAGGNSYRFGTNGTSDAPLLTINPNALLTPARLIMNGGNGGIVNNGTLQTNNPSQYVGLLGGDVNLNGGGIVTPGGRVDLGGLKSAGTVTVTDKGWVFSGDNLVRGDVSLTNGAVVIVSAQNNLGNVNPLFGNSSSAGSSINITANNVNLINNSSTSNTVQSNLQAGLGANTFTTVPAGDININATGKVTLDRGGVYQVILTGAQGQVGDIKIDANSLDIKNQSDIYSVTAGKGNAGNINIKANGNVNLTKQSTIRSDSVGIGNAGNIDIKTTGNIDIAGTEVPTAPSQANSIQPPLSFISSNTYGIGNTGKIILDTTGDITFRNQGGIFSTIVGSTAQGNSNGISIISKNLTLSSNGDILTDNLGGKGNAGNIDINTTGDIAINGYNYVASISSGTSGQGDTGKITIDAQGNISLNNQAFINSNILPNAVGNSKGISISAKNLSVFNNSGIFTDNVGGKGNAGNIDIKTNGDIAIFAFTNSSLSQSEKDLSFASISSSTSGKGNTGKVTIDASDNLLLDNKGNIFSNISNTAEGDGEGIIINVKNLSLANDSLISTANLGGKGTAGNIEVKTSGDLTLIGSTNLSLPQNKNTVAAISSDTAGQGDTGKIIIDTKGKLFLDSNSFLSSGISPQAKGNSKGIKISSKDLILINTSNIFTANLGGIGNAGNIEIKNQGFTNISNNSEISSSSLGQGSTANISIDSKQLNLNNKSGILTNGDSVSGGDITIVVSDRLLMRNSSGIITTSGSNQTNSSGGNITITAPFIVTAPNENSDIVANAFSGSGGKVTINTQQNFWISPLSRAELQQKLGTTDPSLFNSGLLRTNDIISISQGSPNLDGQITLTPPEIDPSRGLSPLPNQITDPSNRINPNCSPKAIGNNSFTSVGRGGIPASPKDPLNEEQIAANWVTLNPQDKLPSTPITPPAAQLPQTIVEAQAWRREQNGDILLVAQSTTNRSFPQSQPASGCATR